MDREITERAQAIDEAATALKARVEQLSGLGPADELAILVGALQRVSSKLARRSAELESEPLPDLGAPASREPGGDPVAVATPAPPAAAQSGLAIVATELALSGSSREDVAGYLRERYDVQDATELLDEVFGAAEPG